MRTARSQVAGTLNGLSDTALILEGSACDTAGENLTLLVEELLQEFGILVVNVLDTALLETAVLLLLDVNCGSGQVADF